jgi:hypothetical protein
MPPNNRESSIAFLSTSGSALHGAPPPDACHLVPWLDRMNFKGGSSGCVGKGSASRLQNNWAFLGNVVPGDFTPVLAKHGKSFNLIDTLSVGVDRIQRNFESLQRQVELWRETRITDDTARLIFYSRSLMASWKPANVAPRGPPALF